MVLWHPTFPLADGMGIVETHQPFPIWSVQCQRIVETVRFLRRYRHTCDDKSHPVSALRIHNEYEPVEIKQRVESRIARSAHYKELSH